MLRCFSYDHRSTTLAISKLQNMRSGLTICKVERQCGHRDGDERVHAKLFPGKATVDVSHVSQESCGNNSSDQESKRVLESGIDSVFHFASFQAKALINPDRLFFGLYQGRLNWNHAIRGRMQSRNSDNASRRSNPEFHADDLKSVLAMRTITKQTSCNRDRIIPASDDSQIPRKKWRRLVR
jgi:hypothetical protein